MIEKQTNNNTMSIRDFKRQNPDLYRRIEKSITRAKRESKSTPAIPHFWKNGKLVPATAF
jgi:hypothetical protein